MELRGLFIADLVASGFEYVAQVERENIKQRQAEGIASARLRGVRFGRPTLDVRIATAMSSNHSKEVRLRGKRPQCF